MKIQTDRLTDGQTTRKQTDGCKKGWTQRQPTGKRIG